MNEPVKVAAVLDTASTRKDGSVKIVFETQELDAEKCASLFSLRNQVGWLIFAPNGTPEIRLPIEPAGEFKNDKTPSQRLRSVLFVQWNQLQAKKKMPAFEEYYKFKMNGFIESVKDELDAS